MIARETTRLIAELVVSAFTRYHRYAHGGGHYSSDSAAVYDFLYDHEFPAWICNAARKACSTSSIRPLQDFVMKLHTGESQSLVTKNWTWPQREKLGQQYLQQLYKDLQLGEADTALHHLELSEEHYLAGRWDDSISNSRKFLECVLREVARCHSSAVKGTPLSDEVAIRPVRVRDYLEAAGLIETKEKGALSSVYGLLSETGGHPYMAENEQARLLRHLALTLSQFVMLRFRGSVAMGG
jgi:hypothetical protein